MKRNGIAREVLYSVWAKEKSIEMIQAVTGVRRRRYPALSDQTKTAWNYGNRMLKSRNDKHMCRHY